MNLAGGREGEVEEVVEDEDLAVAVGAGADADGGDAGLRGDAGGEFAGDAFEDDGDGAGVFERAGVGGEAVDGVEGLALHAIAAHAVDGLRREADVGDDGDFGVGEAADEFGAGAAAFDLDGLGAGFLDEAEGVARGVVERRSDRSRRACRRRGRSGAGRGRRRGCGGASRRE